MNPLSPDIPMQDILDIKPSVVLPAAPSVLPWILWGSFGLGALVLGLYFLFRRKNRPAPSRNFHAEALELLEGLKKTPPEEPREYYAALARAFRLELESGLCPGALERTLEELIPALELREGSPEEKKEFRKLLQRMEGAQFGGLAPASGTRQEDLALLEERLRQIQTKEE